MSETFKPETAQQVLDMVRQAIAAGKALDVFGHATKRSFGGPPADGADGLDLSALNGITLYEPAELVMSAAAATPIGDIHAALEDHAQRLAFEPPNLGPLLGSGQAAGTVGGVFACNLAGPRRLSAGAARDHILGFNAVNGHGEFFKSGGRVVKNVTGFDMSKLITGSFGTLAVMTDVTFKVLPAPEETRTVLVAGGDASDAVAVAVMGDALCSSNEVSAAAHLPADISALSAVSRVGGAAAVTALRVEGPGPSVEYRAAALRRLLGEYGETDELDTADSHILWREIRDAGYFVASGQQVWRLSVPPAEGAGVAAAILDALGGRVFFDWGGGLIWLAIEPREDAGHETVRAGVEASGGHATLIRAAADVRSRVAVFHPQPHVLAQLTARVRNSFDPHGVLCPGRMI